MEPLEDLQIRDWELYLDLFPHSTLVADCLQYWTFILFFSRALMIWKIFFFVNPSTVDCFWVGVGTLLGIVDCIGAVAVTGLETGTYASMVWLVAKHWLQPYSKLELFPRLNPPYSSQY